RGGRATALGRRALHGSRRPGGVRERRDRHHAPTRRGTSDGRSRPVPGAGRVRLVRTLGEARGRVDGGGEGGWRAAFTKRGIGYFLRAVKPRRGGFAEWSAQAGRIGNLDLAPRGGDVARSLRVAASRLSGPAPPQAACSARRR